MGQLARWLTYIGEFDFDVIHKTGTNHGNANGLSSRPKTHTVFTETHDADAPHTGMVTIPVALDNSLQHHAVVDGTETASPVGFQC